MYKLATIDTIHALHEVLFLGLHCHTTPCSWGMKYTLHQMSIYNSESCFCHVDSWFIVFVSRFCFIHQGSPEALSFLNWFWLSHYRGFSMFTKGHIWYSSKSNLSPCQIWYLSKYITKRLTIGRMKACYSSVAQWRYINFRWMDLTS